MSASSLLRGHPVPSREQDRTGQLLSQIGIRNQPLRLAGRSQLPVRTREQTAVSSPHAASRRQWRPRPLRLPLAIGRSAAARAPSGRPGRSDGTVWRSLQQVSTPGALEIELPGRTSADLARTSAVAQVKAGDPWHVPENTRRTGRAACAPWRGRLASLRVTCHPTVDAVARAAPRRTRCLNGIAPRLTSIALSLSLLSATTRLSLKRGGRWHGLVHEPLATSATYHPVQLHHAWLQLTVLTRFPTRVPALQTR